MSADVIVEEVRRVRDELVKRYGGLDGWIQHLQAMDRARARTVKRPALKQPASRRRRKGPAAGTMTG
jgi:hypothetical protein